jgi:hypothetical protein
MAVILQPCANKDAREHYVNTIENTRSLDSISQFLNDKELDELKEIYPQGQVAIWGVTPSQSTKWERIQAGDITLLAKEGAVFASAVTTYKIHSHALASQLWGFDNKGNTWEYIYFLSEVKNQHIPYKELNKVIPYNENYVIQGFSLLDEEKSINVLKAFDLESETYFPNIDTEELFKELKNEDNLETKSTTTGRKEQSAIRRLLFRNKPTGTCCICNKEYPVKFLWAAHIKKRAKCSLDEKKDLENIAAPMCKFGCDELYEKGYIGVKDGSVTQIKDNELTDNLQSYINSIADNSCSSWNDNTKHYFDWHYKNWST